VVAIFLVLKTGIYKVRVGVVSIRSQCRREGGEAVQITGTWRSRRRPVARLCFIYFCLFRWYLYLSTVQINPFRPTPSHSATRGQSFRFSVRIFSRSAIARGPEIISSPGPEPPLGGPDDFADYYEYISAFSTVVKALYNDLKYLNFFFISSPFFLLLYHPRSKRKFYIPRSSDD
jgi:hypothetical protein